MWTEEEFDTELYDAQGRYIGRWRMGYRPEWDRVVSLYPLEEENTVHYPEVNKNERTNFNRKAYLRIFLLS